MMLLTLSHYNPLNTVISDADKRTLYAVSTPFNVFRGTTKVHKSRLALRLTGTNTDGLSVGSPESDGEDSMEELARIHWHALSGSRLVYNSQVVDITSIMPAKNVTRL